MKGLQLISDFIIMHFISHVTTNFQTVFRKTHFLSRIYCKTTFGTGNKIHEYYTLIIRHYQPVMYILSYNTHALDEGQ